MHDESVSQPESRGAAGAPDVAGGPPPRDLTMLDLVNVVLRYRGTMLVLPLLFLLLGVASARLRPRMYAADGAFLLQGAGGGSQVAGLAAQFGLSVPGAAEQTPQLYADLITSRRLLDQLAATRFAFTAGGRRYAGTPAQLYRVRGRTPDATRSAVRKLLRGSVSSRTNLATGVVGYSVTTPWPPLSEQMAARLLVLVKEFNLSTRQSQAAAERRFTEGRVAEARAELRRAEDELQGFLATNRSFEGSPRLVLVHQRLQRAVSEREAVFTLLVQAYERARIDEVRDTPVLTVVETPEGSARALPRDTVLRGLLLAMLGVVLAVGWAFWRDALRRSRERQAPELQEFLRLREQALRGLPGRRRRAAGDGSRA